MERYRANTENPELEWETEVIFDDVVKREYDKHPEHTSRRKQIIFFQETFGLWNPIEVGHYFGLDEKTIRRFLSRRGVRKNEYEEIKKRYDAAYASASIIEYSENGLLPRRAALNQIDLKLGEISIGTALKRGMSEKAVYIAEQGFKRIHDGI